MGWGRRRATRAVRSVAVRALITVLTVLTMAWSTLPAPAAVPGAGGSVGPGTGYLRPVPGPVLTPFRPPTTRYGAGHRGVDLAAETDATVRAAGAGRVVFAGALAGRGVVSIEHEGGLRTTYEPVSASVVKGAQVVAGQVIGVVEAGHAACAPAACLHWGARMGETYLDPLLLLTPLRVRLKPW